MEGSGFLFGDSGRPCMFGVRCTIAEGHNTQPCGEADDLKSEKLPLVGEGLATAGLPQSRTSLG